MAADEPVDLVVIGAQKAASTFFADALASSGRVFVQPDEIPYFESPFFDGAKESELAAALSGARPGQLRGIKRADYLARPEVPKNLASVAPSASVVAVLREPVARTVAATAWYVLHGVLPVRPVQELLTKLLDRWDAGRLDGRANEVIEYSLYGTALLRWGDSFPLEQLQIVDSAELRSIEGVERAVARVCQETHIELSSALSRTNEGVYNPLRLRVRRLRVPLVFDWTKTDTYQYRPHRRYRPIRTLAAAVPLAVDRYLLAPMLDNKQPEIPDHLRERLVHLFAPDAALLAEVGFDTSGWIAEWNQ